MDEYLKSDKNNENNASNDKNNIESIIFPGIAKNADMKEE